MCRELKEHEIDLIRIQNVSLKENFIMKTLYDADALLIRL